MWCCSCCSRIICSHLGAAFELASQVCGTHGMSIRHSAHVSEFLPPGGESRTLCSVKVNIGYRPFFVCDLEWFGKGAFFEATYCCFYQGQGSCQFKVVRLNSCCLNCWLLK